MPYLIQEEELDLVGEALREKAAALQAVADLARNREHARRLSLKAAHLQMIADKIQE